MFDITAIVIGATGQTGSLLVEELLQDDCFKKVRILVRKKYEREHPKLETIIVNFSDGKNFKEAIGNGDVIFSCIGTTMKSVHGDKQLYRTIDFDINVNAARFGYENGISKFVLVSAIGANAASSNFYVSLKGQVEEAIAALPFESIHIMKPSLLLGSRKEFRLGEKIFQMLVKPLSFLFAGKLKKYKPVEALAVAKAMIAAGKLSINGIHRYQYAEMMRLITMK